MVEDVETPSVKEKLVKALGGFELTSEVRTDVDYCLIFMSHKDFVTICPQDIEALAFLSEEGFLINIYFNYAKYKLCVSFIKEL